MLLVSTCCSEPACELSGSLAAAVVAETILTTGVCSEGPSRPVLLDLDNMSITHTLVALLHDVMLRCSFSKTQLSGTCLP